MIIYNSMIVWIVVLGVWNLIYINSRRKYPEREVTGYKVSLLMAFLTFGYIIFWVGMRSGVADTATYITDFKSTPTSLSEIPKFWKFGEYKSPGFVTFNIFFKHFISTDYHIWLMTIAVLTGIPIILVMKKRCQYFFYSLYLFMTSLIFFWMLNGMRQFLVAAIMFFLSDWIEKKKTISFMIVVLLMSTIHFTILIMIPMYFFVTAKPFGKKIMIFILLLLIAVMFLDPFVSSLESMLADTAYKGATAQFAQDDGVNPLRVLVMLVPTLIAFIERKYIQKKADTYINICINMSVICAGIYFLGIFTSGILVGRLPVYFEIYNIILLPYLLKECFTKGSSKIMFILCAIGFFVYYYLQMKGSYYVSDITGLLTG